MHWDCNIILKILHLAVLHLAVLHLAVLHLVVLQLVVLDCNIKVVLVNVYTFLLLIYLPIVKCFICIYVSVCMCEIQDKVIVIQLNICTITQICSCISWRTKNHVISDYNQVYCYVIDYVTMRCWYQTRQKSLRKTGHYQVCCINLNKNKNIY